MMSTGPRRLGKYELQEHLGRGGMGEVWKAYDTQLRRYVAIKLLQADLQASPDFASRFTREAQFIASLHHPNIVQIHDFQFADTPVGAQFIAPTTAYMVMDYVEGGTLADYIRATSRQGLFPSAADIVYLFTAISLALDYAHQRGMIHRDIKPANILLDKRNLPAGAQFIAPSLGEPILTDFGIARLQGAASSTITSSILGTPRYISPEQAKGLPGDERSDLYSLGIILYEMVTGVAPFQGDNAIAVMLQHLYEMPTPPILLNPNVSPALSAVVLQSIAKDPEDRFPTASAMTVALAQALNVPVPASLNRPAAMNVELDYNPLQPPNLFPEIPPTSSHLLASSPSPFTQLPGGNGETRVSTGVINQASTGGNVETRGGTGVINHAPTLQPPPLPASPPSPLPPTEKSRRRGLYITLAACIIILLVGMGIGAASLLASPPQKSATATPNPSGTIVGHIVFISSQGTFDQVQIDLQNIPVPPAGKIYYAWLDNVTNSEAIAETHWQLCVNHGIVHCLHRDPQHSNLLGQNNRFLITEEKVGALLDVPDFSARFYYAQLSHNGLTTFEVKACPSSSISNGSNPCR